MSFSTLKKVVAEFSEKSAAVANELGGASYVFWQAWHIASFAMELVR